MVFPVTADGVVTFPSSRTVYSNVRFLCADECQMTWRPEAPFPLQHFISDPIDDGIQIFSDLGVTESDHPQPSSGENGFARRIILTLVLVDPPIDLDD